MLTTDGYLGGGVVTGSRLQNQDHLELAGRRVEKHLQLDSNFPYLVDQLKVTAQGVPEVSGLLDHDYPSLTSLGPGLESLAQLAAVKRIPLPVELFEQFAHMQCNCTMGLFVEIGRAWLTIDSNIFVWTYENGGDLAYFDGLGETILGVGLLKPKAGIFQRQIKYLLCLTTPVEIVLLGVSFIKSIDDLSSDLSTSEMHLIPEPLFSLPSDNVYIPTVVGMDNGRVFMGGKDGCLYELVYQAEEGWFSRKCRKVNHSHSTLSFLVPSFLSYTFSEEDSIAQIAIDNSRNILYTRSAKGTITVYDLGTDGQSTNKVTSMSQSTILQNATGVAKTIDQTNFTPIVHVTAVEARESSHVHLVVVTHTGVRLYFTVVNLNNPQCTRPVTLQLIHVRLPPGFSAVSPPQRPNKVHAVHYRRGTLLMASSQTEDSDILWCLSNDSFAFQHQLMETQTTTQIDGKTWALAEVPSPMHNPLVSAVQPPIAVTQHQELPRKFVLVSAQGSHILTKLRPVDQLRQLLLDYNGPDCDSVRAFFLLHQEDQACATCLILACSSSIQDKQIVEWATRAYFLYGGEPQLRFQQPFVSTGSLQPGSPLYNIPPQPNFGSPTQMTSLSNYQTFQSPNISGFHPAQVSTPNTGFQSGSPFSTLHQSYGRMGETPGSPGMLQTAYEQPGSVSSADVQYSGRHNGLYLFFSRIVRRFWEERLVQDVTCKSPQGVNVYLASSFTGGEMSQYIEQLNGVRNFLIAQRGSMLPLGPENISTTQNLTQRIGNLFRGGDANVVTQQQQIQKKLIAEAHLQERSSIYNLQLLVERTAEVLGLWKVLYDHQFHVISSSLHKDYQNQLRSMTFKDLIIGGRQLASVLIANLINRYLGDNATTDAISARLREVCPTIYKAEDATFSKANELLMQAQKVKNKYEKEELLREAMQLCKQVVPEVNMPIICGHLQSVHSYDNIVDLCLLAASRRDPQKLALHYYRNGERPEDQQGYQAFLNRMECYKYITDALGQLLVAASGVPHSSSIPKLPGPPTSQDPSILNPEDAREWSDVVLHLSLKSDDEMFHVALFNWLMDQKLEEKLLDLKSPYLEGYLKRAASHYADNLATLDLQWKYYEKNNNYSAAAKILATLASRHGTDVSLQQRLEYLSRAIVCLKGAEVQPGSRTEGEYLHELEEKMEVARIQYQILDALTQSNNRGNEDAISRLNSNLMDVTLLYEEFAYPFNLHECQLAIIHCAGLHDPSLVETLWQNIIDKELDVKLGSSVETRVITLSNKLKHLGKMYASSHKYFPLPFLIKYLESKSSEMNLDQRWVFSAIVAVGVSLPKILELYDRFYKSKDPQWLPPKKSLHILKVLSQIVTSFADSPNIVLPQERRHITVFFLDAISSYLVDLQALDATDQTVRIIIESFRSTQIRLERTI